MIRIHAGVAALMRWLGVLGGFAVGPMLMDAATPAGIALSLPPGMVPAFPEWEEFDGCAGMAPAKEAGAAPQFDDIAMPRLWHRR